MSNLILGKNPEVDNNVYHGDREYTSSSGLKLMFKNPKEYYRQYILGDKSNAPSGPALDFGSYIHSLILEPHKTEQEFAIFTGYSRRGAEWDAFRTEHINKTILLTPYRVKGEEIMKRYKEATITLDHPEKGEQVVNISSFFQDGHAESTYTAEIDGVKVKVRTDYHKEWDTFGSINDVKTTSEPSLSKENITKICARLSYDISAALYVDVLEIVTGKPHNFFFLFISTETFEISLIKASKQMIENGRRKYKEAIRRLKIARETGKYFTNSIEEVYSPGYDVWFPEGMEVNDDN